MEIAPVPTGKLDQQNLQTFDLTQRKLQLMTFSSREGIRLNMDHRSLRKVVYSHSEELGLTDLGNRIQCPIQNDPNKHQRTDCWAVTDKNIREAAVKIFEFTTFDNPRIITLERYPPTSANKKATFFIDIVTGNAAYFQIGGQQDGKLWSLEKFSINSESTKFGELIEDIFGECEFYDKDISDESFRSLIREALLEMKECVATYNDSEALQSVMVFFVFVSAIVYSVLNPTLFSLVWR